MHVYESERAGSEISESDTIPPVIILENRVDTAYLYTNYNPRDVRVLDKKNGNLQCCDATLVVSGDLNLNVAGTCFLNYDVTDEAGNAAATVTRTVHVVENKSAFLNGAYNVACTCTSVAKGITTKAVSSTTYYAEISSEPVDHFFKIISLNIGKDHVAVSTRLNDSLFDVGFFSPNYFFQPSSGTGTLSSSRNSFTIETVAYNYSGEFFTCRNVFTRKLVIMREE